MESNLTAVEWLVNQFRDAIGDSIINVMTDEIKQAKEIEKQQQEYFFRCGRQYQLTGEGTFTEVYNETFNK
jgi:hypothetical protein